MMFNNFPQIKFLLPIGSAVIFAGAACYVYYNLLNEEKEKYGDQSKDVPLLLTKIEIKVPKHTIGAVIGRQGSNIKQIEERTSTTIKCDGESTFVITGKLEKVERAKELILIITDNIPIIESYDLKVPNHCLGKIIGRNGATIRNIQKSSGAQVKVCDLYDQDTATSKEETLPNGIGIVKLKGSAEQINDAKLSILNKVKEHEEMKEKIQMSVSHMSKRSSNSRNYHNESSGLNGKESDCPADSSVALETSLNKVFVSAVDSGSHFWVQSVGPKVVKLERLVTDMTAYYNDADNREMHEIEQITVGDIVAARFPADHEWYRGRICEKVKEAKEGGAEEQCRWAVFYVDFGDTEYVGREDVCELRTDFLQLGFQAVECCLANIDLDSANSVGALEEFEKLTRASECYAIQARVLGYKVTTFSDGNPLPHLRLIDSSGKQSVDIAEELVSKGLANRLEEQFSSLCSSVTSL